VSGMWIASQLFTVDLGLWRRANRRVVATQKSDRGSRRSDSGEVRRPWRVLLVDDDDNGRELCGEYLSAAGYEVLQAENGAEAVDVAIRRKPDLVVMDLEMPVMGGLEAIQRLRDDNRTGAIPVIVLSANGDVDAAKAARVGCDTCLVKPCDPDELDGIIRAVLDTSRLEHGSRVTSRA
jgi:CheY-like chemotaxis protein